jgi:preprotein translocase subunit SecY
METVWKKIKMVFADKALRNRVLVVLAAFFVFRLMAAIPVPGVDAGRLAAFLNNNQFFGVLNIFSGGGLSTLSLIMLGVGPFITASIILQLLTIMIPRLKEMYQEEGEAGRAKFAQYTRLLAVPLAALQGFSLLLILQRQGVLGGLDTFHQVVALITIMAGSIFLMWIGEIVTEFGIGNGISLLIFAGIVAKVPQEIGQFFFSFDASQIPTLVAFIIVALLVIAAVVYVSEAERSIPVTYAKRVSGNQTTGGVATYLPLRVNQAGVMPIIFALSILLFPQIAGSVLSGLANPTAQAVGHAMTAFVQNTYAYAAVYFVLVFLFTYFYTAITFDPHALAENLQKSGAFVPGIRPGRETEEYVGNITSRITFVGALFLGVIAIIPLILKQVTGITAIAVGGTALLIVVSVVLDLLKRVDAQLSMREY